MLQSIGFSRSSIEQIFVVTQLDIARHLYGEGVGLFPVHQSGVAVGIQPLQDALNVAAAGLVRADEMGSALLTLECLVMLRAGQTAAQSRAADFEVVALLNGVCLVQQRIDRAGNGLAGVGVQRLVAVDQDAQEPVWAFLLKADIPQAKAHAFDNGKPLNIVDGTSFEIEPNSFVVLVGGSGTGKSSLLTCITGTAPCTKGSVRFDGLDTADNRNAFEAVLGYVPQKDIMHDNLTVEQSLTFTAKLRIAHDATRAEINAAVAHAIEAVDLTGREKTLISQLSGGQKKRVSIAMELLANPRLLILDEPTSGLSPDLDRSMMELCRKLSHQNCTVLMVTHNMSNINLCDKIAFLGVGGVLCYYGAPEKLHRYFDVELTSDIFEKLRVPELIEQYRQQYFTTPEFNRLVAAWPEAAQEADKRCSQ